MLERSIVVGSLNSHLERAPPARFTTCDAPNTRAAQIAAPHYFLTFYLLSPIFYLLSSISYLLSPIFYLLFSHLLNHLPTRHQAHRFTLQEW